MHCGCMHTLATENAAGVANGGGMAIRDAQVRIEGSSFRRNSATQSSGGAIGAWCSSLFQCEHMPTVDIVNCTFDENCANRGGAICSGSSSTDIVDGRRIRARSSTFTLNRASSGGAVMVGGGASTQLRGCIFVSNNATAFGGACRRAGAQQARGRISVRVRLRLVEYVACIMHRAIRCCRHQTIGGSRHRWLWWSCYG